MHTAFPSWFRPDVQALRDMVEWWPKIAWGGVLAGHDYCDMILCESTTGHT